MQLLIHLLLVCSTLVNALVIPSLKDSIDKFSDDIHGLLDSAKFSSLAPVHNADAENIIPHRYIIVFKDGVSKEQIQFHKELITTLHLQQSSAFSNDFTEYLQTDINVPESMRQSLGGIVSDFDISSLLSGYIAYLSDELLHFIRLNPLIAFIEHDTMVHTTDFNTQNNAPWGLARISHRESLNLANFNKYLYDDDAGKNVDAYVIDTGVDVNHVEFHSRAHWGKTIPLNDQDIDGNGHGTHVAGTIGSQHYGVAKSVNIIAVKVLRSNGSGSMSDVVKGVEFAVSSHLERMKNEKNLKGSVANMSLGGGKSPALDLAVNAAVKAGIHFAVAAGNENQNACNSSPASAEQAVTVGASTISDERAYFSNWGECVDIFAPGLNILSTYIGANDDVTATLSGTSMASPHVAGLLAYYLSLQPEKSSEFSTRAISTSQLKKKLIEYATKDVLEDLPEGTPNVLIYNGGGQDLSDFWNLQNSKIPGSNYIGYNYFSKLKTLFDDLNFY
ncbi:hypothetical protein KAFR_0L00360 [Kazachstania africana CBS 2517]|uniref:Peptidase S8/S53 domain-containing protein n=1 Tax=Kazachstania africana (strain ATCC 22294 / BCRC 22015 / CBS 2517 / CECT 1963 / NBRC 1671 / NRRL Y-8276) TaxID=1071382 RepID=H2B1Z3_KAZAF|nr:hypothetical protein KAFR_0L00360 [Kazachstania africana CBS 2517]CCF60643.1 hypothetical protein KAFR_0L00360 [Kazachstania africana CBS 2517]